MGTAVVGSNDVGKGEDVFAKAIVVLEGDFDTDFQIVLFVRPLHIDNFM